MEWRQIAGYANYFVSDTGLVKNQTLLMKPFVDKDGYHRVTLSRGGKQKKHYVHRLVCAAFNGEAPTSSHQVAHGDGSKSNNTPSNLRWATCLENHRDKVDHGTAPIGKNNGRAILSESDVVEIRAAVPSYGYRQRLAAQYGVRPMTISMIRGSNGKWAHVQ